MFDHIPLGDQSPKKINVIIEVPADTRNKYEYDHKLGIIKLDRVLHSPLFYPFDYGFVPQTLSGDGDPLDVMVYTNIPTFPGCMIEVRPIAVMYMSVENGTDEKILAVPSHNPIFHDIRRLKHIPAHFLKEIEHFFMEYKRLEDKEVRVDGWELRREAYRVIRESHRNFLKAAKAPDSHR
jgi:inorganic pyrophosphatase